MEVFMAGLNTVAEVLHRIRVKLYPNYLPKVEGEYIARTDSESMLSVEQVCAALKNRGGFTGSYDDLVEHVRLFLNEVAYQLCDGYAVNAIYFSMHPKVRGTFNSRHERVSEETHPVAFAFRVRGPLRDIAQYIVVEVEGIADTNGYIEELTDTATGAVNETITVGENVVVVGHKLKVDGAPRKTGLYFVCPGVGGDPDIAIKVAHLAVNDPSRLVGIVPELPPDREWYIEVRTDYSGSPNKPLKETRFIRSDFTVKMAPAS
jgi:hypothetical protein